jgi:hypothetical protein
LDSSEKLIFSQDKRKYLVQEGIKIEDATECKM